MSEAARLLGIAPSAFPKNVIVKATDLGRKVYAEYVEILSERRFKLMFEMLDEIPFEYVQKFAGILRFNFESIRAQTEDSRIKEAAKPSQGNIELIKIS